MHDDYVNKNFNQYDTNYKLLKDSINYYSVSLLKDVYFIYKDEWQIDSLICLNSSKNELVSAIIVSSGKGKKGRSDAITKYLGKKIKGNWYFFQGGGTLIVPRDMYGKDENHPLSFKELSVIARKEMFGVNAFIKKDGEFVVNDKWVKEHFEFNGMCAHCKTHEQYDSTHWKKITDKWKHKIDTNEYNRQLENIP